MTHGGGHPDAAWEPLALLAVDPALQGAYIWGFSDYSPGSPIWNFLQWHARAGQVVRVSASASPRQLGRVLDTEKTFTSGLPAYRPGLVARAKSGVLLVASADLLRADTTAALSSTLGTMPTKERPLVIAGSEGPPKPHCPIASVCAFWVHCAPFQPNRMWDHHVISAAQARLYDVHLSPDIIEEIARLTADIGCPTPMVDFFAARAARARAALFGRGYVSSEDVHTAVQLVATPRAALQRRGRHLRSHDGLDQQSREQAAFQNNSSRSHLPETNGASSRDGRRPVVSGTVVDNPTPQETDAASAPSSVQPTLANGPDVRGTEAERAPLRPTVVIVPPRQLFRVMTLPDVDTKRRQNVLNVARRNTPRNHGPIRAVTSARRSGTPVAIPPTIVAALPWQRLRRPRPPAAVRIMPEDLRRYRRQSPSTVLYILAVDGSGSMAQSRMQLAKGAALAVLQGAYKQRRYVSLVEFRDREATVLCPPGRSATTIRRLITDMSSGGGTPLPTALDVAARVAAKWKNRHPDGNVHVILFTDGKANVPLNNDVAAPIPPAPRGGHASRSPATAQAGAKGAVVRTNPGMPPGSDREPRTGETLTATRERRRRVWSDVEKTAAALIAAGIRCYIIDSSAVPPGPEQRRLASLLHSPIIQVSSKGDLLRRRG